MSKVISFRLNPENPRDAKALVVLQNSLAQGFSTRHTITEGLLSLATVNSQTADFGALSDLSHQIKELLANIEISSFIRKPNDIPSSKKQLSEEFVSSILKAAKPGLRLDS